MSVNNNESKKSLVTDTVKSSESITHTYHHGKHNVKACKIVGATSSEKTVSCAKKEGGYRYHEMSPTGLSHSSPGIIRKHKRRKITENNRQINRFQECDDLPSSPSLFNARQSSTPLHNGTGIKQNITEMVPGNHSSSSSLSPYFKKSKAITSSSSSCFPQTEESRHHHHTIVLKDKESRNNSVIQKTKQLSVSPNTNGTMKQIIEANYGKEKFALYPSEKWDCTDKLEKDHDKDGKLKGVTGEKVNVLSKSKPQKIDNAKSENKKSNYNIKSSKPRRWRAHQITEDYVSLVGNIMYPNIHLSTFGYNPLLNQYPLEHPTTLGLLTHPIRRPTVVEKWSPYEIAMFEAALCIHGKQFHIVQKIVQSKNTKEIVEFYYVWKKTSHYKEWKRQYEMENDTSDGDDEGDNEPDNASASRGSGRANTVNSGGRGAKHGKNR